jgi:hypothetical protein
MYESDKPYAEANATQQGRRYIGGTVPMPTAAPIEKPRLAQQLDQLDKVLVECHQIAGSVEQAVDRILGPVPQDCAKEGPAPVPSSVEQKMALAINYAENLMRRLGNASQRLNSAV